MPMRRTRSPRARAASGHAGGRHSPNGGLWNIRVFPASLRLDACELHHLAPLLGFLGDELGEVGGREREYLASEIGQPRLDCGVGVAGIGLPLELVSNFGGRGRAPARW